MWQYILLGVVLLIGAAAAVGVVTSPAVNKKPRGPDDDTSRTHRA